MADADESIPRAELLGLGEPVYTAVEVSEKAGLALEDTKRLWRALGFVVVPEEDVYFTEADLAVLRELARFMQEGFADLELVLGITRAMSQSVSRIAETEVDAIRFQLSRSPELIDRLLGSDWELAKEAFGSLERFLVYVWRRRFEDALQRAQLFETEGSAVEMAVGFADLVGFTRLSTQVDEEDLARIIERFEASAQEAATAVGGRVVKTIGDEVMFVADDAAAAADMALAMVEDCSGDDAGYEIRVGVARGDLTLHHGDYFGPTVNLASRAARAARPNTVLIDDVLAGSLDGGRFEVKPIPSRRLKGIGSVQLHVLRRAGER